MCMVYTFREVKGNVVTMGKHMKLRVRQAHFKAKIEGLSNNDIIQLNYAFTLSSDTLSKLIINIESVNKNTGEALSCGRSGLQMPIYLCLFVKQRG